MKKLAMVHVMGPKFEVRVHAMRSSGPLLPSTMKWYVVWRGREVGIFYDLWYVFGT